MSANPLWILLVCQSCLFYTVIQSSGANMATEVGTRFALERGTWKNTRMNLNLFKYTLPHRVRPRANYGPPEVEHLHASRHNASADFCFVCFA